MFERNLIFDLGMHDGYDSRFYLDKGFRVVAVEANPDLCDPARGRFASEAAAGRFHLVDKALWVEDGKQVTFHIRDDRPLWSSVFPEAAMRDAGQSRAIEVGTTTIASLFEAFGVPYYLKSDIEGADGIVAEQLMGAASLPPFVSMEFNALELPARLRDAGYDRFQIINQAHLRLWRPPHPAREGHFVDVAFHGKMSGLFGRELHPGYWGDFRQLAQRFERWQRLPHMNRLAAYVLRRWGKLTKRGWLIAHSWLDVHATTEKTLRDASAEPR